jgi:hypothetical protein
LAGRVQKLDLKKLGTIGLETLVRSRFLLETSEPQENSPLLKLSSISIILIVLAVGMWYGFPYWDDAWLYILVRERGPHSIASALPDRPLVGYLMQSAWALGFVPVIALSLSLWTALGFLSARLLKLLFPTLEGYALLVAMLTISPVLTKAHLAIFNVTPTAVIALVIAYLGLFVIYERSIIAGILLFTIGILISEYAVPVALITLVLLAHKRRWKALVPLSAATILSYSFIAIRARENTSPIYVLTTFKAMLLNFPFTFIGAIWQSLIGAYTESLGQLSELSLRNRPALVYMILGAILSLLLHLSIRSVESPQWKQFTIPLLALMVGISPVCLMNRIPYPAISTRFLMPVAPLASVLFIALLAKTFRARLLPAIIVGLICASAAGQLTWSAIRQQRMMSTYSQLLRQEVASSEHLVIAVFSEPGTPDYVLTGEIAKDWPTELELKFWAYNEERAEKKIGQRNQCATDFYRSARSVERSGPIDKILLVSKDGFVEPYCK